MTTTSILMRLAVAGLVGLAALAQADAQPASMPGATKMLVHGNYCGPGNNAPAAPVDAIDAACARHDACTPPSGYPGKACNARLEREAHAISLDPRQPDDVRAFAGMVEVGARLMPTGPDVAPASDVTLSLQPATSRAMASANRGRKGRPVPEADDAE